MEIAKTESARIMSSQLGEELSRVDTKKEVLEIYLKLDKNYLIEDQEKVAGKLLELGEPDTAMEFIKMAEARRVATETNDNLKSIYEILQQK